MDIVDLLIMRDELCEDSGFLNVPNSAGSIDGAGPNQIMELGVPVERGQRSREIVVLGSCNATFLSVSSIETYLLSLILQILRQSPEVARRSGLSPF